MTLGKSTAPFSLALGNKRNISEGQLWRKRRKESQLLTVAGAHELEMRAGVGNFRHRCPTELDQRAVRANGSKDT